MIEIIVTVIVVIIIILILVSSYTKKNKQDSNNIMTPSQQSTVRANELDDLDTSQNKFDIIVQSIREKFRPTATTNEDECENQLLKFLSSKFPNIPVNRGHTSQGRKIDLVIEGTYALELILVANEGKLISLMDQIMKSKQDFSKIAVILVDVNQIPFEKIEEYCMEYEKLGVTTIIKKA